MDNFKNLALAQQLMIVLPLSLKRIAEIAGFTSEESLCDVFQRQVIEAPEAFQARIRKRDAIPAYKKTDTDLQTDSQVRLMNALVDMIENRGKKVVDIAKDNGFKNADEFRAACFIAFGVNPIALRAKSNYIPSHDFTLQERLKKPADQEFKNSILRGTGFSQGRSGASLTGRGGDGASWYRGSSPSY